jgi:hypothetical protein
MYHNRINSLEHSKLMAADLLSCKGGRACCEPISVRSRFLKGFRYELTTEQLTTTGGLC